MLRCEATTFFPNASLVDHLSIATVKDALVLPAREVRERRRPPPPRGLLRGAAGGVFDAGGRLVAESYHSREGREVLLAPDGMPASTELKRLDGEYLYGGIIFGFYGHFLLETLSRAWFWTRQDPGSYRGIIFHKMPFSGDEPMEWLSEAFGLLELDSSRIIVASEPVTCATLQVAQHAFEVPWMAHPLMVEAIEDMSRKWLAGTRTVGQQGAAYVSRTKSDRVAIGEPELERILSRFDIDILHLEGTGFKEKIEIFNRYEAIIGLAGSGLHNVLFSLNKPRLFVLNRFSRIYGSYPLIDQLKGIESEYAQVGLGTGRAGLIPPYLIDVHAAVAFLIFHGLLPTSANELAREIDAAGLEVTWRGLIEENNRQSATPKRKRPVDRARRLVRKLRAALTPR